MTISNGWLFWAALTTIFAKIGIAGIDSDLATLLRTVIILFILGGFVWHTGKWSNPLEMPARTLAFLCLSGLAAGASWICYFRALQIGNAASVASVDKFSLVLIAIFAFTVLGERPSWREWLGIALVAAGVLVFAIKR